MNRNNGVYVLLIPNERLMVYEFRFDWEPHPGWSATALRALADWSEETGISPWSIEFSVSDEVDVMVLASDALAPLRKAP